jgi:hypothetical protein
MVERRNTTKCMMMEKEMVMEKGLKRRGEERKGQVKKM